MILTRVVPQPIENLELDDPATRARLLELYAPPSRRWLRTNLVTSVSGSVSGADGTSATLTSRADRRILGVIRELADVVVVGAVSVRAEGYRAPSRARLAIVTASGDLRGHGLGGADLSRVVVACPASAVETVRESLGDVTTVDLDVAAPMQALVSGLRALSCQSIVCEGGPSLVAQLLAANLVDEVCMTTSPVLNGAGLPPFGRAAFAPIDLDLAQLFTSADGYLFARWTVTGVRASLQ